MRESISDESLLKKPFVLFVCTHNSARSQMAEGYFRARYSQMAEVGSAGTEIHAVHPLAVSVMAEIGIDISDHRSKLIGEFFDKKPDFVITVCDTSQKACPFVPGAGKVIHAGYTDPSSCNGTPSECQEVFRMVRDGIITWIDHAFVPDHLRQSLQSSLTHRLRQAK